MLPTEQYELQHQSIYFRSFNPWFLTTILLHGMHQNLSVNSSTPSVIRSTQPTSSSKPDIEFDTNTCHQALPISDDFKAKVPWKHVHLVAAICSTGGYYDIIFESNGSLLFEQGSLWSSTSKTCEISCAHAQVAHHRWVTKPIQTLQKDKVTKQTCLMWILKSNIEWQCLALCVSQSSCLKHIVSTVR